MLEGRARGGPRDGVKLSAPETWNGKVRIAPKKENTIPESNRVEFYPGHYVWREVVGTWVWVPHFVAPEKKRYKSHSKLHDW